MPALPPVSKVIRVALKYTVDAVAQELINRFFLAYTGTAPTDVQLGAFAGSIADEFGSHLVGLMSPAYTLSNVKCEDLTSATSAVGEIDATQTGTRSGSAIGIQVAAVLSEEIARRYRGGHPRLYLPFGTLTDLADEQAWTTTFALAVPTDWVAFLAAVEGDGWSGAGTLSQVNVSYYEGFTNHTYPSGRVRPVPTLRATPVVDTIVALQLNPLLGTQRRRTGQKHR